MTKWGLTFAANSGRSSGSPPRAWKFVTFEGPNGSESRGIVDMLAIRKNHSRASRLFSRGDLFEIVLIQIKGGSAPRPTLEDQYRLRRVARYYRARHVVLAEWKKGAKPTLYRLRKPHRDWKTAWKKDDAADLFG